ncbi:hypothetical protein GCM10027269_32250 [Kribbella endophytica]
MQARCGRQHAHERKRALGTVAPRKARQRVLQAGQRVVQRASAHLKRAKHAHCGRQHAHESAAARTRRSSAAQGAAGVGPSAARVGSSGRSQAHRGRYLA